MRLVYLAPVPWHSFAQRPHRFVEWFHDRTTEPVLWIDPYPTRLPQWGDLKRLLAPSSARSGSHAPSWLRVLKPGGMPLEPMPGCSWLNRRLWRDVFGAINEFSITSEIVLAVGKPSALAQLLLERYPHCTSMYDAMDDFPAFYSGLSRRALVRREQAIARLVDVVWTSSSELLAKWKGQHPDVCLVKNGLDLAGLPVRVSLSPRHEPAERVFGYVGTMGSWFDWDWVAALARARPNDDVRLVGPIFERPGRELPDNVKLLPACEHAMALNAMLEFDVGLIPFKKNALTAAVDPIKYYEYRALGLPVISTDFGEMSHRADDHGVFISRHACDLPALVERALQFENDPAHSRKFATENSWAARFDSAT